MVTWLISTAAWGHVAFENVESGAVFIAGSLTELQWVDTIPHNTTGYHLQFVDGDVVEEIVNDLPPSQHSYEWQVPMDPCDDCWLVVIQDNEGSDYSSRQPIRIVTEEEAMGDGGTPADDRMEVGMHLIPDMPASSPSATGQGGATAGAGGAGGWPAASGGSPAGPTASNGVGDLPSAGGGPTGTGGTANAGKGGSGGAAGVAEVTTPTAPGASNTSMTTDDEEPDDEGCAMAQRPAQSPWNALFLAFALSGLALGRRRRHG